MAVAALIACVSALATTAQLTVVDYGPAPTSLALLANRSAAVIHGKVTRVSPPHLQGSLVVRDVVVDIAAHLKDSRSSAGNREIVFSQLGGTVTVDGRERTTAYALDPFSVGDEAVLFLEASPRDGHLEVMYGNAGAFRRAAGTDEISVAASPSAKTDFGGRQRVPLSEFIARTQAAIAAASSAQRREGTQ